MVFGLALRDTISGTRLIEQVPVFPTRSRPTKRTLGWQQFDVNDAEIALLTAPWLNAPTEKKKRYSYRRCSSILPHYFRLLLDDYHFVIIIIIIIIMIIIIYLFFLSEGSKARG